MQLIYIGCSKHGTVARITSEFLDHLQHLARETPLDLPPLSADSYLLDVAADTLLQGTSLSQLRQSPMETYRWLQYLETGGNPALCSQLRKQTAALDKLIISLNSSLCGLALSMEAYEYVSSTPIDNGVWHRWLVALGLAMRDPLALCASGTPSPVVDTSDPFPWWRLPQYGDCPIYSQHSMSSEGYVEAITFDPDDFDTQITISLSIASSWQRREASLQYTMLAAAVITVAGETAMPEGMATNMSFNLSWGRILKAHRLTLAMQVLGCVLECGFSWLQNLSQVTQGEIVYFIPGFQRRQVIAAWQQMIQSWPASLPWKTFRTRMKYMAIQPFWPLCATGCPSQLTSAR
jgi:hypothetical protein